MRSSDEYLAELELNELVDKKIAFDSFIMQHRSQSQKPLEEYMNEENESRAFVLKNHILVKFLKRDQGNNNSLNNSASNNKELGNSNQSVDTLMFFSMSYFLNDSINTNSKEQIIDNITSKINKIHEYLGVVKDFPNEKMSVLNKYITAGKIIIRSLHGEFKMYLTSPVLAEIREYQRFNRSLSNWFAGSYAEISLFMKKMFYVLIANENDDPYQRGLYNLAKKFATKNDPSAESYILNYEHLIKAYTIVGKMQLLTE